MSGPSSKNQWHGTKTVRVRRAVYGKIHSVTSRKRAMSLIAQKDSFLLRAKGVSLGIALNQEDGCGFIAAAKDSHEKRLQGDWLAFLNAGGNASMSGCWPGGAGVDTGGHRRMSWRLSPAVIFRSPVCGQNPNPALLGWRRVFLCHACAGRAKKSGMALPAVEPHGRSASWPPSKTGGRRERGLGAGDGFGELAGR